MRSTLISFAFILATIAACGSPPTGPNNGDDDATDIDAAVNTDVCMSVAPPPDGAYRIAEEGVWKCGEALNPTDMTSVAIKGTPWECPLTVAPATAQDNHAFCEVACDGHFAIDISTATVLDNPRRFFFKTRGHAEQLLCVLQNP